MSSESAWSLLGTVTHLYAPNTFHHLWVGDWARAFPGACVPRTLRARKKRPDLRIDRAHDVEPLGSLGATFDEVHIGGFALEEACSCIARLGRLVVAGSGPQRGATHRSLDGVLHQGNGFLRSSGHQSRDPVDRIFGHTGGAREPRAPGESRLRALDRQSRSAPRATGSRCRVLRVTNGCETATGHCSRARHPRGAGTAVNVLSSLPRKDPRSSP